MTLVYTVQNHIHLGLPGEALSMYNEPPHIFYHVQKRAPHYELTTSFNRSRVGNPAFHVLKDSVGNPMLFKDFEFELRVSDADLSIIEGFAGRIVNFIDNRHCPDLTDHVPYIKSMAFLAPTYDNNLDPLLNYNIVTIMLKDTNTRSPI